MGASLEKSIYVFRSLYLSSSNHQRNLSSIHVRDLVFCAVYAIIAIAAVGSAVLS
jgi:hypothetical protein